MESTIWLMLYVTGAIITRTGGTEKANSTENSIGHSSNDYDPNYPDYADRDYPTQDYYDYDRGGRSFEHDENSSSQGTDYEDAEDFMMKQLRSTIPGTPGVDYALYQSVPDTSFKCESQASPGFYGDVEAQCQVFHICQEGDRQDSFLCPLGTVFNQISFICDWWFNFKCEDTPSYFHLNDKFDSTEGSTSMKDAMKKMRSFHDQKDMHMIMGIARVHKKLHRTENMVRNRNSPKRSMSPKIRNLFMLRMRKDRLERIKNAAAIEKNSEEFVTASTSPVARTPLALKATGSASYLDVTQSEYTTTSNSLEDSNDTFSTPMTPNHVENLRNTTEVYPYDVSSLLDSPFKSLLHLPGIEMIINGSIITTVKLDRPDSAHLKAADMSESQSTTEEPHLTNTTEQTELTVPEKIMKENEFYENISKEERETEYAMQTSTNTPITETSSNNYTQTNDRLQELTESASASPYKPFRHQNNFIFGNDTHISVSVTIRSKSGHSKLQWKRLPGLKRVRKIRFKNEDEPTTSRKPLVNYAQYKKRNSEEKFRSRVMWIPAMKNSLDRRLDWKSFLESRRHATGATTTTMKPYYSQPLKLLAKATLEGSEIPPINISDMMNEIDENKTEEYLERLTTASVKDEAPEELNATSTTEYSEANIFLTTTEKVAEQSIAATNLSELNAETLTNTTEDQSNESQENCKTICIKLLRSLHVKPSNAFENGTGLEKAASLTLFDYDSSETKENQDYGRKSVLGILPSEQWTVKYEPGPNCLENTDDDKVLVKGWSVIIDTGYVTKEKTVKKRGCTNTAVDSSIILTRDLDSREGSVKNGGIKFNSHSSHIPQNSKSNYGSTDQQYWLNLVKNWLDQSPRNIVRPERSSQNTFPNSQQEPDEFSDSENSNSYVPSEDIFRRKQKSMNYELKNPQQSNFPNNRQSNHRNAKLSSGIINDNNRRKDSTNSRSFSNDKKRRLLNIQGSRMDSSLDLQTERSEWFRATRSANNWPNSKGNRKKGNTRDWNSGDRDRTESNPRKDSRKGYTFTQRDGKDPNSWLSDNKNSARDLRPQSDSKDWWNEDPDYFDQDYDDRSSNKPQSRMDWMDSRQDEHSKWDSSQQENWGSKSPQDRNIQVSGQDNSWSKGSQRMNRNNQNSGEWPATRTNDWSSGRRNGRNSKGNDPSISWKSDSDVSNNKGKQSSWPPKSSDDANRGSVTDEWNWPQSKGYDGNTHSTKKDNRNDWASGTKDNKPSSALFPKNKNFQKSPSEEGDESWGGDSYSDWSNDDAKNDEHWMSSAPGNKGNVAGNRNAWNSDENDWSSEEDVNYKPQNSRWDNKGSGSRDYDKQSDGRSKADNKRDWSSGSRGGRDKGFAVRGNESPVWPSKEKPNRAFDEKTNDKWPSKSPKAETRPSDDRSRRRNIKGDSISGSNKQRTPNAPQEPWGSGNQNKWKDDEEMWMRDVSGNDPSQKGTNRRLPTPAIENQNWKLDLPDTGEWFESNKGQAKPESPSWNTEKGNSPGPSTKSNTDWNNRRKMESDPWPDRNPISRGTKGQNRNTDQPEPWSKGHTPNKGTNTMTWSSKMPSDSKSKDYGRDSQKSRPKNENSWGPSKGSKGNMGIPQSPSSKGSPLPKPKMPWKKDTDMKNSSNSKGDSEMKKIVWSVQISSDGKPGNGWVPITLRPNLRGRGNGSQSDWSDKGKTSKDMTNSGSNSKGTPTDEDWKNKKGSNADEDWNNKKRPNADEDWSGESSNVPKKENSPKDSDWNNKGEDQANKRRSSRNDDWNTKGRASTDEEWDSKMSNQGIRGSADIWDIGRISTASEDWNVDEDDQTYGKSSLNDDRDSEGASLTDDSSYEDGMNPSAKLFHLNENTQDERDDEVTEADRPTTHIPAESFNRLLYIPASNVRHKRENKNRGRHFVARDIINRTYKIIKSGEILDDDVSKQNNNNFFVAKAGIIVTDNKDTGNYRDTNSNNNAFFNQDSVSRLPHNSASDGKLSTGIKSKIPFRKSVSTNKNSDTLAKESIIREIWSSPLISSNLSASGWIPVTTFKAHIGKQFTTLDHPSEKNRLINRTNVPIKSEQSNILPADGDTHDLDHISSENISQDLPSYPPPKTFNILLNDKDPSKNKNVTEMLEHETKMKVGNETLRILSFSDVMKQLENEDNHPQSSQNSQVSWNMPVTSDPKTYSLKLIDPSNETTQNASNSWMFPSNENGAKQAWILVENGNTTGTSNGTANRTEQTQNTDAKKVDAYKIIVGNRPTKRDEEHPKSSRSSSESKAHPRSGPPQFTFTNWDKNSDWTPIIRSIGRVVTFNRTLPPNEEAVQ